MSKKASPWENGFQESFYSQYKVDLGEVNRFETIGELIEAIHKTVYYLLQRLTIKQTKNPFYLKREIDRKSERFLSRLQIQQSVFFI